MGRRRRGGDAEPRATAWSSCRGRAWRNGTTRRTCVLSLRARSDHRDAWLVVALRPYNPEGVSFVETRSSVAPGRPGLPGGAAPGRACSTPAPDRYAFSDYHAGDVHTRLFEARGRGTASAARWGWPRRRPCIQIAEAGSGRSVVRVPLVEERRGPHRQRAVPGLGRGLCRGPRSCGSRTARMQFLFDAAVRSLVLHSPGGGLSRSLHVQALLVPGRRLHASRPPVPRARGTRGAGPRHVPAPADPDRLLPFAGRGVGLERGGALDPAPLLRADRPRRRSRSGGAPSGAARAGSGRNRLSGGRRSARMPGSCRRASARSTSAPTTTTTGTISGGSRGFCAAAQLLSPARRDADPGADSGRRRSGSCESVEKSLAGAALRTREARDAGVALPAARLRGRSVRWRRDIRCRSLRRAIRASSTRRSSSSSNCMVNGGFYQDIIHSGVNPYLTLHVAQVLLRAGDPGSRGSSGRVARLASPTGQWPEAVHPRTGGGCMGDGHHAWASAEWVLMIRNHVRPRGGGAADPGVRESFPSGSRTASRSRFGPAPTSFGAVSRGDRAQGRSGRKCDGAAPGEQRRPAIEVRLPGFDAGRRAGRARARCSSSRTSESMNILMVTNTFTPHVGGVANSVAAVHGGVPAAAGTASSSWRRSSRERPGRSRTSIRVPAIQRFNGSDFAVPVPVTRKVIRGAEGLPAARRPLPSSVPPRGHGVARRGLPGASPSCSRTTRCTRSTRTTCPAIPRSSSGS